MLTPLSTASFNGYECELCFKNKGFACDISKLTSFTIGGKFNNDLHRHISLKRAEYLHLFDWQGCHHVK